MYHSTLGSRVLKKKKKKLFEEKADFVQPSYRFNEVRCPDLPHENAGAPYLQVGF